MKIVNIIIFKSKKNIEWFFLHFYKDSGFARGENGKLCVLNLFYAVFPSRLLLLDSLFEVWFDCKCTNFMSTFFVTVNYRMDFFVYLKSYKIFDHKASYCAFEQLFGHKLPKKWHVKKPIYWTKQEFYYAYRKNYYFIRIFFTSIVISTTFFTFGKIRFKKCVKTFFFNKRHL